MQIRRDTIEKYILQVEDLIRCQRFKEALDIASRYPLKLDDGIGYVITKTRLLNQYKIRPDELALLNFVEKKNPHYSSAPKMILFLEQEVETKFELRKGKLPKISKI